MSTSFNLCACSSVSKYVNVSMYNFCTCCGSSPAAVIQQSSTSSCLAASFSTSGSEDGLGSVFTSPNICCEDAPLCTCSLPLGDSTCSLLVFGAGPCATDHRPTPPIHLPTLTGLWRMTRPCLLIIWYFLLRQHYVYHSHIPPVTGATLLLILSWLPRFFIISFKEDLINPNSSPQPILTL